MCCALVWLVGFLGLPFTNVTNLGFSAGQIKVKPGIVFYVLDFPMRYPAEAILINYPRPQPLTGAMCWWTVEINGSNEGLCPDLPHKTLPSKGDKNVGCQVRSCLIKCETSDTNNATSYCN